MTNNLSSCCANNSTYELSKVNVFMKKVDPSAKEIAILDLQDAYDTLQQNYVLLFDSQEEYLSLQGRGRLNDDSRFKAYMKKISTLFHNYLASFYSFIYIAQVISEKVHSAGFKENFDQMWSSFKAEEVNSFIIDMRNFVQHRRLPIVGAGFNLMLSPKQPFSNKPLGVCYHMPSLRVNNLLLYKRWSAPSKRFLKNQFREVLIEPIIVEVNENTKRFYEWLITQIKNW